jgi:hypothetical protein
MLRFFKYFCRKIQRKNWRFCLKTKPNFEKVDHNIGFYEKRQFFAENWQKSQKIVIITSTPGNLGRPVTRDQFFKTYVGANFTPRRQFAPSQWWRPAHFVAKAPTFL